MRIGAMVGITCSLFCRWESKRGSRRARSDGEAVLGSSKKLSSHNYCLFFNRMENFIYAAQGMNHRNSRSFSGATGTI